MMKTMSLGHFAGAFLLAALLLGAVPSLGQGFQDVTINATGVTCAVKVNRNYGITCGETNDIIDRDERTFVPTQGMWLEECSNECVRLRNELGYPCAAFIYRNGQFAQERKRFSCQFMSCKSLNRNSQNGINGVFMKEECFATFGPTSSPSEAPSTAPSIAPSTAAPTLSPTKSTKSPTLRTTKTPTNVPTYPDVEVIPTPEPTVASVWTYAPTAPTNFPTTLSPTQFPTASPTEVTEAPTFRRPPTSSPVTGWKSPSGISPDAPLDPTMFRKLSLNIDTCQIARPAMGTQSVTYTGFMGTLTDCLKECQYENTCTGILYSDKLDICTKLVYVETTDDPKTVDTFHANYVVYVKQRSIVLHYANFCGQFNLKPQCTLEKTQGQCRWGVGPVGINQYRATDDGWCGRVACNRNLG